MKHKHHIIPRHAGGTDEPSNIVELTVEEHAEAHKKLYEMYGKHEDYVAWKCLSGTISKQEIIQELCRLGGIYQGKRNAESGHMSKIQKQGASLGGKRSAEVCREEQKNAFFDPSLRTEIAKLGGHAQGKKNVESGHLKRIAQLPNKRNEGMIWITDGISNKMINSGDNIDDGWRKGKTQKRKVY
jgi:hypothetical protein